MDRDDILWSNRDEEHDLFDELNEDGGELAVAILTEWSEQQEPRPGSLFEIARKHGWIS